MDDLKTWWEIAQFAGAGATVVLGPVAYLLWKRVNKDTDYIRESDKENLKVLNELATVVDTVVKEDKVHHDLLVGEIKNAVSQITKDTRCKYDHRA